ncbi:MAG: TMEM165/GDT1 family protein [Alphaproteobacteria bacterium]|nr:TMEM165/GDT1 family protein [Alphaproteobacteria bacterium]
MDLSALAQAFTLVGIAELGDKSQLVVLTLAVRLGARPVLLGAVIAFAVLDALAVTVGAALSALVPVPVTMALAAVLFLVFGVLTLRDEGDDEAPDTLAEGHPVLLTVSALLLAELGDKTQLTVAALAAASDPWSTWVGATVALTATSTLAALLGSTLLERMPRRVLDVVAGLLFLAFGLWLAGSALWGLWTLSGGGA